MCTGEKNLSEAVVVGAIGAFDASLVRRMATSMQSPSSVAVDGVLVCTEGSLREWRSRSERGWLWAALDPRISPTSAMEARDDAGAAGIALTADGTVTLHDDHLGAWPIYVVEREGAAYFSNRLRPVLDIVERPRLDRIAWASLMSMRYVPPGSSVVAEVSTLRQGESIQYDPRSRDMSRRFDVPDLAPEPGATFASLANEIGGHPRGVRRGRSFAERWTGFEAVAWDWSHARVIRLLPDDRNR